MYMVFVGLEVLGAGRGLADLHDERRGREDRLWRFLPLVASVIEQREVGGTSAPWCILSATSAPEI